MFTFYWDKLNKWLYVRSSHSKKPRFMIAFDNWFWQSNTTTIRQWSLFEVLWDNGAWWGDLPEEEVVSKAYMDGPNIARMEILKKSGNLTCFFQITFFGVGFRWWYEKRMTICMPRFDPDNF